MTEANAHVPLPAPRSNRPITAAMRLEYWTALIMMKALRLIGVEAASALGGGFLRVVGPMIAGAQRRGDDNLKAIFPEWTAAERRRILSGVWDNLGRTGAEFAHLDAFRIDGADPRIDLHGAEHLERLREEGRPAVFVGGHFANWEIMAIALSQCGVDGAVVYRAANNPLIDAFIIQKRAEMITRLQIPKGRFSGVALLDMLRAGKSVGLVMDQHYTGGVLAPFLGRDACTAPAAARLSLRFNVPIVPVSVERLPRARFRVTIRPPIALSSSDDDAQDIRMLTIAANQSFERDILERPSQWLWLHRRWRAPVQKTEVAHG